MTWRGWWVGMVVAAAALTAAQAAQAGTVTMTIDPAPKNVSVGQMFDLTINVQAGTQLIDTVGAYVNFNTGIIEVTGTTPGTTLPTAVQNAVDNLAGTIDYTATILSGQVSGSFVVVTLHCHALAVGTATLTFHHVLPRLTGAFLAGVDETGTLTGTTVVVSASNPTATTTRTPSSTPTRTIGSPTATAPPTRSPTPTLSPTPPSFCQPAVAFCQPLSPTPTPLATPTSVAQPAHVVAQEDFATPGACICTTLFGQVFDVPGSFAGGRRVTVETTFEQVVDGCLIHISHRTYVTGPDGVLPGNVNAIGGSIIHVTLEGEPAPIQMLVPRLRRASLAAMLGGVQVRPPSNVVTAIAVDAAASQVDLTATQAGTVVTLQPGDVHDFTLTMQATAMMHAIGGLAQGTAAGDLMPNGQVVQGDFAGTLPNPTLGRPITPGHSVPIGGAPLAAGQCVSAQVFVDGAAIDDTVIVNPETPSPKMFWFGEIVQPGFAAVYACALAPTTPTASVYYVRTF